MARRYRIDLIRKAVLDEGGAYTERKDYYADGPTMFYGRSAIRKNPELSNIVNYKVENTGLDLDAKRRVCEVLREDPTVNAAYVMEFGDIRIQFNCFAPS